MANEIHVCSADNFKVYGRECIDISSAYNMLGTYFDMRAMVLSRNTDVNNFQWYYNYLEFMHQASIKNPTAKPSYLLSLGYVPVIYLPSCFSDDLGEMLFKLLDAYKLKYVKLPATSFAVKSPRIDTTDAWMSKIDAAEFLGCDIKDVTSESILRRILE